MRNSIRYVDATPLGRRGRYGLTQAQAAVYRAIVSYNDDHGEMPSIRDISFFADIGVKSVCEALNALVERGWIRKNHCPITSHMTPRGIEFIDPVLYLKNV